MRECGVDLLSDQPGTVNSQADFVLELPSVQILEPTSSVIQDQPSIVIVEQPAPHKQRFRYETDGGVDVIQGASSTKEKKTFPQIQILNYTGRAYIVVSCVTNEPGHQDLPRAHPHTLVSGHRAGRDIFALI